MGAVHYDGGRLLHLSDEEAVARCGKPQMFTTDHGSQFTSINFSAVLKKAEITISMIGKGAWRDTVCLKRLERSIKYGEANLPAYKIVPEARAGICCYLTSYNTRRPHSSLDHQHLDFLNQIGLATIVSLEGSNAYVIEGDDSVAPPCLCQIECFIRPLQK